MKAALEGSGRSVLEPTGLTASFLLRTGRAYATVVNNARDSGATSRTHGSGERDAPIAYRGGRAFDSRRPPPARPHGKVRPSRRRRQEAGGRWAVSDLPGIDQEPGRVLSPRSPTLE